MGPGGLRSMLNQWCLVPAYGEGYAWVGLRSMLNQWCLVRGAQTMSFGWKSQKYVKSMMLSNIVNIFGVVDIFQYHMI